MGRLPLAAVVGVGVGFVLGFAARGCGSESGRRPQPAEPVGARPALSDPPAGARRERIRRAGDDAEAPEPVTVKTASHEPGAAPDVREIPLGDAPSGWTRVEVELVDAEGHPIPGPRVRASPVGDRGESFDWDASPDGGATFDADAEGRGVLRLSVPARYDVRVHMSLWSLWVLDVAAPATSWLRVVDAPLAELEVTTDEALAPGDSLMLQLSAVPGTTARLGDGSVVAASENADWFELTSDAPVWRRRVPTALRWRIQGREGTRVETVETRAGTKVVLRRSDDLLVVHASFGMDAAARLGHRSVPVALEVSGATQPVPSIVVGSHVVELTGRMVAVRVATPRGTVRWSGAGIEAGEATYDLAASPVVGFDVRLVRPDGGSDPVVRCETADATDRPAPLQCTVRSCADPFRSREFDVQSGSERTVPGGDASWAWVLPSEGRETWIAGPVRLAAGGRHVLRFAPGGFVVVARRGTLPEAAGAVSIARADGAPLDPADMGDVRVEVEPVHVLGPFPPGEVVLDVHVGDVRWARYAVTVRAGEHTLLAIGPFGNER